MEKAQLIDELVELVTEVTGVNVNESTGLIQDDVIDSFGMLAVISHLEESLQITIDPEKTTSENFSSVGAIAAWGLAIAESSE